VRLRKLIKTCASIFLSQWEGVLDDGHWIYIRSRHGLLGYGVGADLDTAVEDFDVGEVYVDVPDFVDLPTEEMLCLLGFEKTKDFEYQGHGRNLIINGHS